MALDLARTAYKHGDVPVGAVIVKDGKVLARAYNQKTRRKDSTKHAEIIAITKASRKIHDFRLDGCDMYVTFEPCIMCAGAILSARIDNVYFGAYDNRFSSVQFVKDLPFNHVTNFQGGIMENECAGMLSNFFAELRKDANISTTAKK